MKIDITKCPHLRETQNESGELVPRLPGIASLLAPSQTPKLGIRMRVKTLESAARRPGIVARWQIHRVVRPNAVGCSSLYRCNTEHSRIQDQIHNNRVKSYGGSSIWKPARRLKHISQNYLAPTRPTASLKDGDVCSILMYVHYI